MTLIPAGKVYSYRMPTDNRTEKYWFHFDFAVGNDRMFSGIKLKNKITVTDDEYVRNLFETVLHKSLENSTAAEAATVGAVNMLVAYYLEKCNAGRLDETENAVTLAMKAAEEHLSDELTL